MQKALDGERERAEKLEEKLRRVMAERDALANRARALEGENKALRSTEQHDEQIPFVARMLRAQLQHQSSAESSSADELEHELFWPGASQTQPLQVRPQRARSPRQDIAFGTRADNATPRPFASPPLRSYTFPEPAQAQTRPSQIPMRTNAVRVRHGPSHSISSIPVPLPSSATIEHAGALSGLDRARSPGLHGPRRPNTAGGASGRPRRQALLDTR
ncbi:hypothetical protein EXIGLDRAFT_734115 [Exidia glandulosa HHB12029]|uniref:Uncharacterized protein n=1 Tax=Exidia glandulosa HHB12029 TaxID=1314781 RepID=A0A165KA02_EXIGL|nr:hypothetical protein EXIGLDRAFT_734115 [Exidia glandulosa HHB12029]